MKRIFAILFVCSLLAGCGAIENALAPQPTAQIGFSPENGGSVNFTVAGSQNADTYLWDFGDGTTSTEASTLHQYARNGSYVVKLTVKGKTGKTATDLETITIKSVPGSITFWVASNGWSIDVSVNTFYQGTISQYNAARAGYCKEAGWVTFTGGPGTYSFEAKEKVLIGPRRWAGTFTLKGGECVTQELLRN
jgi:PKD repeat protein